MQDHVETNFRRCNPSFGNACTHEALRRGESAGILDTLESPQALFEKHLKSLHYTDLAHRYVRIEQANGWEEGLVLYNNKLLGARVESVDEDKQTVQVRLCLAPYAKGKPTCFEPAISVHAKQVAFRRTIDPKSVYLKLDLVHALRKTGRWMLYADIVKAIQDKKVMKPFDNYHVDAKRKGEPNGSWTAVRGFCSAFGCCDGLVVLRGNTNITEASSLFFDETPHEDYLTKVYIVDVTFYEALSLQKALTLPSVLFQTYAGDWFRYTGDALDGLLFRIKDLDWDKPVPTVYTDEALRLTQSAGISNVFKKSPEAQFTKHLKSPDYTDLAHRDKIIEQENGWEEALVLHEKQLLGARIESVDKDKQTVQVQLHLPPGTRFKTAWYEPAISVDAKTVAFRCTMDPKCIYLKSDRVALLRKTGEWMLYSDILKAIKGKKVMKKYDKDWKDPPHKGDAKMAWDYVEPDGSWNQVRDFFFAFCDKTALALLGGNTNIREDKSYFTGENKPQHCLEEVWIYHIKPVKEYPDHKGKQAAKYFIPCLVFTTKNNYDGPEPCRFSFTTKHNTDLDGVLFHVKDLDWDKPAPTDDAKKHEHKEHMHTKAPTDDAKQPEHKEHMHTKPHTDDAKKHEHKEHMHAKAHTDDAEKHEHTEKMHTKAPTDKTKKHEHKEHMHAKAHTDDAKKH